jgi:hypothetical protein
MQTNLKLTEGGKGSQKILGNCRLIYKCTPYFNCLHATCCQLNLRFKGSICTF